jgi:electron-transferring-flavoprotein dehydrogenase
MSLETQENPTAEIERQSMDVDIACVGFGPATGGFLTELVRAWNENPADEAFQSQVAPGMPLQVLCYERADDLAAGVSGVVTRAKAIRQSFPTLDVSEIPMGIEVRQEKIFYLLDPQGASNRSWVLGLGDRFLKLFGSILGVRDSAMELPWTPSFLHKKGGIVLSIGQFNQWVGSQLMASGLVQIWPSMPVAEPLVEGDAVKGVRLADQGVDKHGKPGDGFMAGMDVRAALTVVGDGPVGQIGQALDRKFNTDGNKREWALGMKFVIELPPDEENPHGVDTEKLNEDGVLDGQGGSLLTPGTVWHTFGYPEPEIFGFLYVHPDRLVSVGIFVPSWMGDSSRTAYRYLQHFIQHPLLWPHLQDGTLRSWGAKSLEESGKHGEPVLSGEGFARIGEGSGSTNMLTNSGVDEAWATGTQLADAVVELLRQKLPFTKENLNKTYEKKRRASWVEKGANQAEWARHGFHKGFVRGLIGTALAGLTKGQLGYSGDVPTPSEQIHRLEESSIAALQAKKAAEDAQASGRPLHDALMSVRGWPEIPFDGRLLVTQQDALLMGGKVQASPGYADHVVFLEKGLCVECAEKTCVSMCSGQAITLGGGGVPVFEREKCVHCGACMWNCANPPEGKTSNVSFNAGSGGFHSAEN